MRLRDERGTDLLPLWFASRLKGLTAVHTLPYLLTALRNAIANPGVGRALRLRLNIERRRCHLPKSFDPMVSSVRTNKVRSFPLSLPTSLEIMRLGYLYLQNSLHRLRELSNGKIVTSLLRARLRLTMPKCFALHVLHDTEQQDVSSSCSLTRRSVR